MNWFPIVTSAWKAEEVSSIWWLSYPNAAKLLENLASQVAMGVHVCNPRPGPLSLNCCKGQSSPDYRGEENTDKHQRLSFQIAKSMEDTSILGSSQHAENRVYKVALSLDTSPKYRCLQSDSSYRPEVSGVPRTVSIWWCARMYRELRKSEKCCTCYCRKIQIRTSRGTDTNRETGRQFRHELVTLCIDGRALLTWNPPKPWCEVFL